MLIRAAFAAWRQVLAGPLRRILWRSIGLTLALLALLWFGLTSLFSYYLKGNPISADYPVLDGFAFFLAGAGLLIAMVYALPAISALVAGFFLDDAAELVERSDFAHQPSGRALPTGRALLYGLRFAGLALIVNLAALTLFFIPVVNILAFFAANAYLLGREYFELAAGRFRPLSDAADMRREHRATVLLAGAMIAALVLVPLLNLLTPVFGIALMVHVHKGLSARALSDSRSGGPPRLVPGPGAG